MTAQKSAQSDGQSADSSDVALVEELRRGGSAALAVLFDRHADAVYNYCFRRTASWDVAEDVTSTVFLEAWRGRSRVLVHADSALPWLYGIATNVCRNVERSRRRRLRAVQRLPVEDTAPDHAEHVVRRLDSQRLMEHVLQAVAALPRREQEVLALVVWSGLSYEAAANALDVPVGTVRSRLSRARSRLAGSVDSDPDNP
jgi:RNA polymerase sigma-70 factor (ECF subfamily)